VECDGLGRSKTTEMEVTQGRSDIEFGGVKCCESLSNLILVDI